MPHRELLLALGLPTALLLGTIWTAGIWDPHELTVAELGRRAAVHVWKAPWLELPGAENRLPTLGDVGQNELPVMSVAVAFRLLGLGGGVGRLPMALWGLVGVVALWAWLRRMASTRAGSYAALILATTPLYFVQARTIQGDIVTMASQIVAFAGLSVALLDDQKLGRIGWLLLGLGGLVAGFFSRGALIGVAAPAFSVGVTALLDAQEDHAPPRPWWFWLGAAVLLLGGCVAAGFALDALGKASPTHFSRALGAAVRGGRYPTFDAVVQHLGHALFPWSAFLPVALGRLLAKPAEHRVRRLRTLLFLGVAFLYGSHGWIAARTGVLPFAGVGLLAALGGLVLEDFEQGSHPSRALVVVTCLLTALLTADFSRMPEKTMAVFTLPQGAFPEGIRGEGTDMIVLASLVFCTSLTLAFLDGHDTLQVSPGLPWYRRLTPWDDAVALGKELINIWQGNLAFVGVMLEAMLVGLGALLFLGDRFHWRIALSSALSLDQRWLLINLWWLAPLGVGLGLFLAMTVRLWFRLLLARTGVSRAWVAAGGGVTAGLVLALGYYPTLASQLSPRQVFETYQRQRKGVEPLGLLGVAGRTIAYETGGEARSFSSPEEAFRWLTEGRERRWLAVHTEELPSLNALYRARARDPSFLATPDHNLPVLDARSSQVVLASGDLGGQANQNPLAVFLSAKPPSPSRPVQAILEDALEALGWDVFPQGSSSPTWAVHPGKPYTLCLYWRVLAPVASQWKSFIHIDGYGRRHNGDHEVLGGKVPMRLWQPGDIVTDRYEFRLEPNFTPANYALYYGFFLGERRMAVRSGKHSDNRLEGGVFPVR
ncbi:MAG: glycosyltransferase family 39 protein [Myxococcales bacterium]|nr:glycosyltransferase family 39 protein [Polyangiaceae bacterium]MDW8251063.1 glycosyltransferase family 39 protein [Myxococcales bacterium]